MIEEIPILTSNRVILRGFRPNDTERFLQAMTEDATASPNSILIREAARHQAWRVLAMVAGAWQLEGHGYWAIELRETGELIGRIGSFKPRGWPHLEVGWEIFKEYRQHGYATEGVVAALQWYYEILRVESVTFCIPQANLPSQKLAQSLGASMNEQQDLPNGSKLGIWVVGQHLFAESRSYKRHARTIDDLLRM